LFVAFHFIPRTPQPLPGSAATKAVRLVLVDSVFDYVLIQNSPTQVGGGKLVHVCLATQTHPTGALACQSRQARVFSVSPVRTTPLQRLRGNTSRCTLYSTIDPGECLRLFATEVSDGLIVRIGAELCRSSMFQALTDRQETNVIIVPILLKWYQTGYSTSSGNQCNPKGYVPPWATCLLHTHVDGTYSTSRHAKNKSASCTYSNRHSHHGCLQVHNNLKRSDSEDRAGRGGGRGAGGGRGSARSRAPTQLARPNCLLITIFLNTKQST
jgi:hypothetical protein